MIGSAANPPSGSNDMDVTRLTEEEQIALAIQMSMTQADNASKSSRFSSSQILSDYFQALVT